MDPWTEDKAAENVRKHAVTFEEAATVFLDPLARIYDDSDHSVGVSLEFRLLVVVHVERRDTLRIISARPATTHERKRYQDA